MPYKLVLFVYIYENKSCSFSCLEAITHAMNKQVYKYTVILNTINLNIQLKYILIRCDCDNEIMTR